MRLRIVLANIQSGIGITKGYRQYVTSGWRYLLPHNGQSVTDAGAFLKAEDTDIALLTEVDEGSRRSRGVSQLGMMAADSGLSHAQFFPTKSVGSSIREGSAVLSRFPILDSCSHTLSQGVNPRVLGITTLDTEQGPITALVVHLAMSASPREAQIAQLVEQVKALDGPVLLGGDFNERDHTMFKTLRKAGLTPVSVAGYPSWKPVYALQVLFVSHHFTVIQASVPDGARFSDHLPLIVELELA